MILECICNNLCFIFPAVLWALMTAGYSDPKLNIINISFVAHNLVSIFCLIHTNKTKKKIDANIKPNYILMYKYNIFTLHFFPFCFVESFFSPFVTGPSFWISWYVFNQIINTIRNWIILFEFNDKKII